MSRKAAAAGGWPVRPFDPTCRDFEPVDDAVVAQIRAVIAEWHPDDWPAVRAVLEVEVPVAAGRLATLTVRDVRLLFNSLAHRGHGQRHTAHTDVVTCAVPVPAELTTDDQWDAWLAGALTADGLRAKPFTPLPVLGVPGWWPVQDEAFYLDNQVFRPARHAVTADAVGARPGMGD